jgi:hypothetical protein
MELYDEAVRIVDEAERRGIVLRLIGALGVRAQCPTAAGLFEALGRRTDDVDLAGLAKQWTPIVKLFEGAGYHFDERRALLYGNERLMFFHPTGFRVDVFLDRLRMNHELDFRRRLELHALALPPADLLLQKLQIVHLTEKDEIDLIVLFREYDVRHGEELAAAEVAKRLADEWGLYHTATQNLEHLRDEALEKFGPLSDVDRRLVRERVEELLARIGEEPKTLRWKARAAVGPRMQWYRDVGELER